MKQIKFSSYEQYLHAQRLTVMKRGFGPYFCDMEMIRIAEWCRRNGLQVRYGICHGARNGLECDELMRHLPMSEIIGTDIAPYSGKSKQMAGQAKVIEWDFNKQRKEWIGRFDLVYTNSLDHSNDPPTTLSVWLEQLVWNGALFVQWNRSNLNVKGGDCFGADLLEMIDLLNSTGRLVDMIYVKTDWQKGSMFRRHGLECVIYVVRKKQPSRSGEMTCP